MGITTISTQNTISGRFGCLTAKEAESLELERISESSHYAGSGQDFFAPSLSLSLWEKSGFHDLEERSSFLED